MLSTKNSSQYPVVTSSRMNSHTMHMFQLVPRSVENTKAPSLSLSLTRATYTAEIQSEILLFLLMVMVMVMLKN